MHEIERIPAIEYAPPRTALQGCEGLWATAMHDVEYPPPAPLSSAMLPGLDLCYADPA